MTLEKVVSLQRRMLTRILPIFFLTAGALVVVGLAVLLEVADIGDNRLIKSTNNPR